MAEKHAETKFGTKDAIYYLSGYVGRGTKDSYTMYMRMFKNGAHNYVHSWNVLQDKLEERVRTS